MSHVRNRTSIGHKTVVDLESLGGLFQQFHWLQVVLTVRSVGVGSCLVIWLAIRRLFPYVEDIWNVGSSFEVETMRKRRSFLVWTWRRIVKVELRRRCVVPTRRCVVHRWSVGLARVLCIHTTIHTTNTSTTTNQVLLVCLVLVLSSLHALVVGLSHLWVTSLHTYRLTLARVALLLVVGTHCVWVLALVIHVSTGLGIALWFQVLEVVATKSLVVNSTWVLIWLVQTLVLILTLEVVLLLILEGVLDHGWGLHLVCLKQWNFVMLFHRRRLRNFHILLPFHLSLFQTLVVTLKVEKLILTAQVLIVLVLILVLDIKTETLRLLLALPATGLKGPWPFVLRV